ncbi:MAG: peptidoglycan editing factor PgeF [Actinomycetota bacterium]|nr:peptidoglycan editing factor PgeF [Actinomycetota bacterium]
MYSHHSSLGPVDLAFTDRYGGVSAAPFDTLNLALVTDDAADAVAENHRLVSDDFAPGVALVDMFQVHGPDARLVDTPGERPHCDALVTTRPDLVLMVRAADCVPVLLADPRRGVVGAVHAGRPGLAQGVVPAAVQLMREQGAAEIVAFVGPHVCGACYEVPLEMQQEVTAVVPASRSSTSWGTPALDIGAGVRAQLERCGASVIDVSRCTRESADLYSHRRDGERAGRLAGLIRRRSR